MNRITNPFQVLFKQRKKVEKSGYYIQYRLIGRKKSEKVDGAVFLIVYQQVTGRMEAFGSRGGSIPNQ